MKRLTTLALLLICIVSFDACKKYEDGPMFSLRSSKARLKGEWKVTSFTSGGADQLNYVSEESQICLSGQTQTWTDIDQSAYTIIFDESGTLIWNISDTYSYGSFDYFNCTVIFDSGSYSESLAGTWIFTDKKKSLTMIIDTEAITLDIKRLTNKEMELQGIIDGDLVTMSLESND